LLCGNGISIRAPGYTLILLVTAEWIRGKKIFWQGLYDDSNYCAILYSRCGVPLYYWWMACCYGKGKVVFY